MTALRKKIVLAKRKGILYLIISKRLVAGFSIIMNLGERKLMDKKEEVQHYFKICIDNKNKTVVFVHKFFSNEKTIYTNEEKLVKTSIRF